MKVKCPVCGATGTDVEPYEGERADWMPPLPEKTRKEMEQYAFEVYGNLDHRPVRKCLNCGSGIRVSILPPRYKALSDAEWAEYKVRFETWREQDRAEIERRLAEMSPNREEDD